MRRKRYSVLAFIMAVCMLAAAGGGLTVNAEAKSKTVEVLFTSDVHSHLNSFETMFQGEKTNIGGLARLKTIIDSHKAKNPNAIYVDGGDFSMGTLIQTVYEEQAAELRLMGILGCEAITLGNHEFDYRSKGIINMLHTARDSGDPVPQMLVCNIDWSGSDEEQEKLKEGFDYYGVKPYTMIQKGNVNIALVGVFGKDALACAPTCTVNFTDPVEAVKETVASIKANEDADMIICLSHSGISNDPEKSEDEILAQEVPELDLIISGHAHLTLDQPIMYGDTYIVSCGEYGQQMGSISLTQRDNGRWLMDDYALTPLTEDVASNEEIQAQVDAFEASVDDLYLQQFGYTKDQVLAVNDITFATVDDLYFVHEEQNLGSLISDAYLYAARHAKGQEDETFDVAVVPSGTVRDTYTTGEITVTDVFNSFSLGIGEDGVPGYPLIQVYLTGEELRTAAEIDASLTDFVTSTRLFMSGLNFTFNPNRLILNKVTDISLYDVNGDPVELEDDRLYCVVADLYTAQMLGAVKDMSYGIFSIEPKDADGNLITDFSETIIYDGDQELKAWVAIAHYMESFDKNGEGVSAVPAAYGENQGRKVVDNSKNIGALLKNPNKYALIIVGIAAVLILIIVLLVVLVVRLIKKRKTKKAANP